MSMVKPEFRLVFGYPTLTVDGPGGPTRRIALDRGDWMRALRAVAAEIALARGSLTAVLPAAEVWRERVAGPASRARGVAAFALGVAPEELTLVQAPRGEGAAAAVRSETLAEARAFLARAGLKPARLIGDGDFPGFDAPPAFRGFALPENLRGWTAAAAVAATFALVVWAAPWRAEAPAPAARSDLAAPAAGPAGPPPAAEALPGFALADLRPAPRPADLRPLRAPRAAPSPDAALIPMTVAARNLPAGIAAPPASLRLTAVPPPRRQGASAQPSAVTQDPGSAARPLARPDEPVATRRTEALTAGGPRPRPAPAVAGVAVETLVAVLGSAITAAEAATPASAPVSGARPRARPGVAATPVRLAALDPSPALVSGLAAAAAIAPPAPRRLPAPPRPAAAAQPKVAPIAVAPVAPRVQPAPVRVQPAPVRTVRAQPQAPRAQAQPPRVQPQAAAPTRQAARAQRQRPAAQAPASLRGNSLALIGIFGSAAGRHALVQLPNGATERVRAGDAFQGVEITAVSADAVHLRARGRDSVLKLPD